MGICAQETFWVAHSENSTCDGAREAGLGRGEGNWVEVTVKPQPSQVLRLRWSFKDISSQASVSHVDRSVFNGGLTLGKAAPFCPGHSWGET